MRKFLPYLFVATTLLITSCSNTFMDTTEQLKFSSTIKEQNDTSIQIQLEKYAESLFNKANKNNDNYVSVEDYKNIGFPDIGFQMGSVFITLEMIDSDKNSKLFLKEFVDIFTNPELVKEIDEIALEYFIIVDQNENGIIEKREFKEFSPIQNYSSLLNFDNYDFDKDGILIQAEFNNYLIKIIYY